MDLIRESLALLPQRVASLGDFGIVNGLAIEAFPSELLMPYGVRRRQPYDTHIQTSESE